MAEYYYAVAGAQQGPVPEEQLDQMVAGGSLPPDTLVWCDGMPNWQPYSLVKPQSMPGGMAQAGSGVCSVCRRNFPPLDLVQYGNMSVCRNCNPQYVANLPAGAGALAVTYAGFWRRFVAKFIDGIVLGFVSVAIVAMTGGFTAQPTIQQQAYQNVLQTVISLAYSTWMIGQYGATLGKLAMGIRVVTPDGGNVTFLRALGRGAAEYLSACAFLIGYIIAAFDVEKRALHDRLAGTRVIVVRQ